MPKKILIIGAGAYQVPAIQRVREMGFEAYCVDYRGGALGYEYANGYKVIDVKDKERCLAYAKELDVDGVLTWGATLTLPTVSFICKQLGLPCMPIATSEISTSKYLIRQRLTECGLNSAGDCFEVYSKEEAKTKKLKAPFVIKPSDGSGSKGVRIVLNDVDINDAIEYAFEGARDNHVYIEPYIPGEEYSVEVYANNGQVYVNTIVKTQFAWQDVKPVYKQTTYLGITQELETLMSEEVVNAVKALGINWGPCNFDIIVSSLDGKPYIIDVGIRNGQNLIASHIIPYSRGIDELECSILNCIGEQVNAEPTQKIPISSRLLIYNPGFIKEIKPVEELIGKNGIVDIIMRKKAGEILPIYQTKSDICGWVLCKADTAENASLLADAAWEQLKNYIIIK